VGFTKKLQERGTKDSVSFPIFLEEGYCRGKDEGGGVGGKERKRIEKSWVS